VNLKLGYWAPEIYESFTKRVTVIRDILVQDIDKETHSDHNHRPHLHFDFEVASAVRELGHGWKNLTKYIPLRIPNPVDDRARHDHGLPLPPDHAKFCVSVCNEMIHWPENETLNYQAVADVEVRVHPRLWRVW
jgi:hypothetical protein